MSTKTTAAIVLIALAGAIAFSATGLAEPTVALAVEPLIEFQQPTLAEAARNNDYLSFSALYDEAVRRGDDVSQFAALHELWTYAVTDPIGAFYGADRYEQLRRAYPGYAAYIEQYRIVDDRGNVFYPTSETRAFLLINAAVPTVGEEVAPLPVVKPVRVARRDAARPAGRDAGVPPTPQPVVVAPVSAPSPAPAPAPAQVVAAPAPAPAPARTDTAIIATRDNPAGRGILLMILGLIGVGLLALIVRTPAEHPPVAIVRERPPHNVEPLREAAAPDVETKAS